MQQIPEKDVVLQAGKFDDSFLRAKSGAFERFKCLINDGNQRVLELSVVTKVGVVVM